MGRASEKYQRPALIPGQLMQNLPPGGTWWVFFKGSPGGADVYQDWRPPVCTPCLCHEGQRMEVSVQHDCHGSDGMRYWRGSVINTSDSAKRWTLTRQPRRSRESPPTTGRSTSSGLKSKLGTSRRPLLTPGWQVWQEHGTNSI